ncbi:hypothetical protein [Robertkochia sediminum]|uniref:hypothetical protein n=1 Tax=Robertkochia sediminum TaxID=2785326 RepID=UPI0019315572|nr:hypothetical protein [Robertkochia sediminum]MBL7471229.1 hypothetical protein [Robertkochia sediminum]
MKNNFKASIVDILQRGDVVSASFTYAHKGNEVYVYINNKKLDYSDEFGKMLNEWMSCYADYLLEQNEMHDFEIEFELLDNELIFLTTFHEYEDEFDDVYFALDEKDEISFLREKVDCDDFRYENFDFVFDYDGKDFNYLEVSYLCDDEYIDVELSEEQVDILKSEIKDFISENVPYLDFDNTVEQNYTVFCDNSTQVRLVYSVAAGPISNNFDDFVED